MKHLYIIIAVLFIGSCCTKVNAGPYLELGLGDFVAQDWPSSPDCECGVYLGNEGNLGYIEAGIESPAYPIFWKMKARITGKLLHISNTGTGRDTGLHAAFVTLRLE